MNTNIYAHMQTYRIHSYKYIHSYTQKKKKFAEVKGCHEQSTSTGQSQTQMQDLKSATILSKQWPL